MRQLLEQLKDYAKSSNNVYLQKKLIELDNYIMKQDLNSFVRATKEMDIKPLELDSFMHNNLYQPMADIEVNLSNLQTFINKVSKIDTECRK